MMLEYGEYSSADLLSPNRDAADIALLDLASPGFGASRFKHPQIAVNGYRCPLYDVKAGFDQRYVFPKGVAGYRENGFYKLNGEKVEKLDIYTEWNTARIDALARAFNGDPNNFRDRELAWKLGPAGAISAVAAAMGMSSWDRCSVDYDTEKGDTPLYVRMILNDLRSAYLGGEAKTEITLGKMGDTSVWLNHRQVMMAGNYEFSPLSTGRSLIVFDPHPYMDPVVEKPEDLDLTGFTHLGKTFSPTQYEVLLFALASGDLNPAHRDKEYMDRTRFKRGPISHGQLIILWSLNQALRRVESEDKGKSLDSLDVTFKRPLVLGDTIVSPWLKAPAGDVKQYQLLALDQNLRSVIDLKFGVK